MRQVRQKIEDLAAGGAPLAHPANGDPICFATDHLIAKHSLIDSVIRIKLEIFLKLESKIRLAESQKIDGLLLHLHPEFVIDDSAIPDIESPDSLAGTLPHLLDMLLLAGLEVTLFLNVVSNLG